MYLNIYLLSKLGIARTSGNIWRKSYGLVLLRRYERATVDGVTSLAAASTLGKPDELLPGRCQGSSTRFIYIKPPTSFMLLPMQRLSCRLYLGGMVVLSLLLKLLSQPSNLLCFLVRFIPN